MSTRRVSFRSPSGLLPVSFRSPSGLLPVLLLALVLALASCASEDGSSTAQTVQTTTAPPKCEASDCDDRNDCTEDSCLGTSCSNTKVAYGTPCGSGGLCENGKCVPPPDCKNHSECNDGNDCTSDKCEGGSCNNSDLGNGALCGSGGTCQAGTCKPRTTCPDGTCQANENPVTCPSDCTTPPQSDCGNGKCEFGESRSSCATDCLTELAGICGDSTCDRPRESESSCPRDCAISTTTPIVEDGAGGTTPTETTGGTTTGTTEGTTPGPTTPSDTTAPDTTITKKPITPSNEKTTSFEFTASETGSTFECKLDAGSYAACTSPKSVSSLTDGSHTYYVRAKDGVGNIDATPATHTWTVDATPPDTTITTKPSTPSGPSVSFAYSSTETGSKFECKLDTAAYADCSTASSKSYTSLTSGSHTFTVRSTDTVGNVDPTPATHTWTIDATPPDTTITTKPSTPSGPSVPFAYTSTETGSKFECKLDTAAYADCSTGSSKSYTSLTSGSHTFTVRSTDAVGNVDSTPATHTWSADATAPDTSILSKPPLTAGDSATFTYSTTEPGGKFDCKLDIGSYGDCTNLASTSYTALALGSHTFSVRAIDGVGNTDGTPATYAWTVAAVPNTTITASPTDPTCANTATISFTSTETGATFKCKLDSGLEETCISPKTYTGLTDLKHTFTVYAVGAAGADPSPATVQWNSDTTGPSSPTGLAVNSGSASCGVTWNLVAETGAKYVVHWDTDNGNAPFANQSADLSVGSYSISSLTNGTTYYASVRAKDTCANFSAYATAVTCTPTAPVGPPTISSVSVIGGKVGASVDIFGSNFSGITSVKFNGVSATYTVGSSTSINATVPTGANGGSVTVTNASGTGTSPYRFLVVGSPTTMASIAPGDQGGAIAVSGNTVLAVWASQGNPGSCCWAPNSQVYYKRSTDGGATWSATASLSGATSYGSFTPAVAISGSYALIAFRQGTIATAGQQKIKVYRSTNSGSSFSFLTTLDPVSGSADGGCVTGDAGDPSMRVYDGDGNFYLAWDECTSDNVANVFSAKFYDYGATLWGPMQISSRTSTAGHIRVSIGISDAIIVAWPDGDGTAGEIYMARSTDYGGSFGSPQNVTNSSGKRENYPTVAGEGTKAVIAYRYEYSSSDYDIKYVRSTDSGATWSPPTTLVDSGQNEDFPIVTMGGSVAHIAWLWTTGSYPHWYLNRSTDSGSSWWGATSLDLTSTLSSNCGLGAASPITAQSGQALYMIWEKDVPSSCCPAFPLAFSRY